MLKEQEQQGYGAVDAPAMSTYWQDFQSGVDRESRMKHRYLYSRIMQSSAAFQKELKGQDSRPQTAGGQSSSSKESGPAYLAETFGRDSGAIMTADKNTASGYSNQLPGPFIKPSTGHVGVYMSNLRTACGPAPHQGDPRGAAMLWPGMQRQPTPRGRPQSAPTSRSINVTTPPVNGGTQQSLQESSSKHTISDDVPPQSPNAIRLKIKTPTPGYHGFIPSHSQSEAGTGYIDMVRQSRGIHQSSGGTYATGDHWSQDQQGNNLTFIPRPPSVPKTDKVQKKSDSSVRFGDQSGHWKTGTQYSTMYSMGVGDTPRRIARRRLN